MRLTVLILCLAFLSCKSEQKQETETTTPRTTAEKIAIVHGFEKWSEVESISFTFNVKRDTLDPGPGRSWKWWPKEDKVQFKQEADSLTYFRTKMDSIALQKDRAFINDKFWLLIPFQFMWDEGITIRESQNEVAPVSGKPMNKITLIYSDGGYTPGDAYDIFYDENYLIQEWIFRKGNTEEPSLINTFESYRDISGFLLAMEHKMKDRAWNLFFSDVEITFQE